MQGQVYTAIILAKSTPIEQLEETRHAYETIYTQLSPFANMQLSYGTNTALSVSDALSHGTTTGTSYSKNTSTQTGSSYSKGSSESHSVSKPDKVGALSKTVGSVALGVASLATAPLTGGVSLAAAGAIGLGQLGVNSMIPKTNTDGNSKTENYSQSRSKTEGESHGVSKSESDTITQTRGFTSGLSNNMQLTMQNKTLIDTLKKIELQLERINEGESIGMWECAAYFLSDTQETAEMAAATYKALMKGEKCGVETSYINFWGRQNNQQLPLLYEYITNFLHPIFEYHSETISVPVTASSLVCSNELAIPVSYTHLTLPTICSV